MRWLGHLVRMFPAPPGGAPGAGPAHTGEISSVWLGNALVSPWRSESSWAEESRGFPKKTAAPATRSMIRG